jgi:hypothetical protein
MPKQRKPLDEVRAIREDPDHLPEFPKDGDVGFDMKPMVRWLDPVQLADTAKKAILSQLFATYADQREVQVALAPDVAYFDYSDAGDGEFWFDHIADVGDGFDPTYGMAYLLAAPTLTVDNVETRRGRFVILGGDEVYPTASRDEYQNRLIGPYAAALPYAPPADAPHLFAIPGNHDWYDGLTSFTRQFCQERWIGGWKTWQRRSYFALKLPHGYWLWSLDVQLQSDIDEPQKNYFNEMKKLMKEGDKVILCTAEPTWVYHETKGPDAYETMRYFDDNILGDTSLEVIGLAGDVHCYARYQHADGRQRFVAGGGGAYLAATHDLPHKLDLPHGKGTDHFAEAMYDNEPAVYPTRGKSAMLAAGAIGFALWNRYFAALMGALYLAFVTSVESTSLLQVGMKNYHQSIAYSMMNIPFSQALRAFAEISLLSATTMLLFFVLLFGLIAYADFEWTVVKVAVGSLHTALHILAIIVLARSLAAFNDAVLPHWSPLKIVLIYAVEMFIAGGIAGSIIFGLYYFITAVFFRRHLEHAFSSQALTLYKQFIRFRITADGIDFFTIGVDSMPNWELKQQPAYPNGQQKPWYAGDIKPRIVDRGSVHK